MEGTMSWDFRPLTVYDAHKTLIRPLIKMLWRFRRKNSIKIYTDFKVGNLPVDFVDAQIVALGNPPLKFNCQILYVTHK